MIPLILSLLLADISGKDNYVVVVLDGSGSMSNRFSGNRQITRMQAAQDILINVLSGLPKNTQVGIVAFGYRSGWVYPVGPVNESLPQAIRNISAAGGTPLGQYMKIGADELLKHRSKNKFGNYKLIVVTDGESTDDAETPLTGQYGILSKGIQVEVIGIDMSTNHSLATKVPYRSAKNPEQLHKAIKDVLAETNINNQSEDYAVIASLDNDICQAMLTALSEPDNNMVGVKPPVITKKDETAPAIVENGNSWWYMLVFIPVVIIIALNARNHVKK